MSKIKPILDRVIIRPEKAEDKTKSGIIIPETAQEKPLMGTVVSVGKGNKDEPMILKEGDYVMYGKFAGVELNIDGEVLLMMRESDVFATLETVK